ncbi:g8669 [Coccomyxa viridis]|uniref:G8669 protein n=1 Tax=Coccomyxa viridis TaxID=1274662 RepID=A0ABP1G7N5_9CHLO
MGGRWGALRGGCWGGIGTGGCLTWHSCSCRAICTGGLAEADDMMGTGEAGGEQCLRLGELSSTWTILSLIWTPLTLIAPSSCIAVLSTASESFSRELVVGRELYAGVEGNSGRCIGWARALQQPAGAMSVC